jgi:hypothetical protein
MMTNRHAERGQTVPFWAFSILMSLSLIFFIYNYSNTLRYQIRAQNAADSAATAALAGDAANLNSVQTLLLALNVQEFETRNVIAGVPDLLTGGDTNCSQAAGILATSCLNDLAGAVNGIESAVTNLQSVETALNTFSGQLTGNNLSNIPGTVSSFYANNCVALSTDCAFKYTTYVSLNPNGSGLPYVDEYACEKVPTFQAAFLPKSPATYYAVGHTTYALAPLSQNINAYNNEGGLTSTVLGGTLNLFPTISASAIAGSFAGLNINSAYYETVPVGSTRPAVAASSLC